MPFLYTERAKSGLYRLQEKIITKLESTVSALTVDGCMFAQSNAVVQRWMGQAFNVPMFIYLDLCLAEKHTHHTAELPHRPTTDPGAACEIIASLVKSPRWAGVGDPIHGNMTSLKPDCHHTVPCTQPELFLLENTVYGNVVCNAFIYRHVLFFPGWRKSISPERALSGPDGTEVTCLPSRWNILLRSFRALETKCGSQLCFN